MIAKISAAVVALALAASLLAGCPHSGVGPRDVLDEYARAVADGRLADAYRLTSADFHRLTTFEEFANTLRANPEEVRSIAREMGRVDGTEPITARVRYGLGDELVLVLDGSRWRIDSGVFDFYSQRTPRDALRSFVRAVSNRRYDVVLRFVPTEDKAGMTVETIRRSWEGEGREEIHELIENLRAHLDDPIEVAGDRATMPYAERFAVRFLREDGVWKIEDLD